MQKTIYTIGHSTRPIDEFIRILKSFDIKYVADIRLLPGSNRHPQFNRDELEASLNENEIDYGHYKELGGRRRPVKDSLNTAWKNATFQGYADHMITREFIEAADKLAQIAGEKNTVYMCAEAVWWSCHRAILSDHFKINGWKVLHIMSENKYTEHPFTKAAKIINGKLSYSADADKQQKLF